MPVVLLTPVGLDAACWDFCDPPSGAERHEWPGHGQRPLADTPPDMASLADEVAATYDGTLDVIGVSLGSMVAQRLAIRWFTAEFLAEHPDHPAITYSRRTLEALDPEAYAQAWEAIATHDALAELPTVRAHFTCLAGRQDVSSPPEQAEAIASAVPGARLVVLNGPHMLFLEDGPAFGAELRDHLGRVG